PIETEDVDGDTETVATPVSGAKSLVEPLHAAIASSALATAPRVRRLAERRRTASARRTNRAGMDSPRRDSLSKRSLSSEALCFWQEPVPARRRLPDPRQFYRRAEAESRRASAASASP